MTFYGVIHVKPTQGTNEMAANPNIKKLPNTTKQKAI